MWVTQVRKEFDPVAMKLMMMMMMVVAVESDVEEVTQANYKEDEDHHQSLSQFKAT